MQQVDQVTALQPIAFFIPALNGGGAQRVVVNLANALVDLTDRPVHIALARAEGQFLDEVRPEVKIIDLGTRRASRSIFALAQYLRKEKPAVLCSTLNYVNVCASLAWYFAGKPCRLVLREASFVRSITGGVGEHLRGYVLLSLMRLFYPRADKIIALGKDVFNSLIDRRICQASCIEIIGNPVAVQPRKLRNHEFDFRSQSPVLRFIVAVGRLSPPKGFDTLIRAFTLIPYPDLRLIILGEGELRPRLEALATECGVAERVEMPGFLKYPQQVMANAELFVLSSLWEGLPNALLEALALGLPIVATNCPGEVSSILCDGALGHLVPPERPDAMAAAISEALRCPRGTELERIQRAADFSTSNIAQQYLKKAFLLDKRKSESI